MKTVRTIGSIRKLPPEVVEYPISRTWVTHFRNAMIAFLLTVFWIGPIVLGDGVFDPELREFSYISLTWKLSLTAIAVFVSFSVARYDSKHTKIRIGQDAIDLLTGKNSEQTIQFADVVRVRSTAHTNGVIRSIRIATRKWVYRFENLPEIHERILSRIPKTAKTEIVRKFRPQLPLLGTLGWLLWVMCIAFFVLANAAHQQFGMVAFLIGGAVLLTVITAWQVYFMRKISDTHSISDWLPHVLHWLFFLAMIGGFLWFLKWYPANFGDFQQ